jgi:hypothetical protein
MLEHGHTLLDLGKPIASGHIAERVNDSDLVRDEASQERVARGQIGSPAIAGPHEHDGAQTSGACGCSADTRVVGLCIRPACDDDIGACGDGFADEELGLPYLVAAEYESCQVVALDENTHPELGGQVAELVDWGRKRRELDS